MGRFTQDFRFALRTFLRGRSVTVLSVLAFALGIGVTTAVFSIFNAVLLNPLPTRIPTSSSSFTTHSLHWRPPLPRFRSTTTGRAAIRCLRRSAARRRPRSA